MGMWRFTTQVENTQQHSNTYGPARKTSLDVRVGAGLAGVELALNGRVLEDVCTLDDYEVRPSTSTMMRTASSFL